MRTHYHVCQEAMNAYKLRPSDLLSDQQTFRFNEMLSHGATVDARACLLVRQADFFTLRSYAFHLLFLIQSSVSFGAFEAHKNVCFSQAGNMSFSPCCFLQGGRCRTVAGLYTYSVEDTIVSKSSMHIQYTLSRIFGSMQTYLYVWL